MNPYGATERSIVRLGRTARTIMGDIASQKVKVGQTGLLKEKMKYDIAALQGKHKVDLAGIKSTYKHRETLEGIQLTQMQNQKEYQEKTLSLNRDKFDLEKDTVMTVEEAAGILYLDLPEQQTFISKMITGMSDKMRGIKLPGKEWAGIFTQIRDAHNKQLQHKETMGLLGYRKETAELTRAKVEKGDKVWIHNPTEKTKQQVYPPRAKELIATGKWKSGQSYGGDQGLEERMNKRQELTSIRQDKASLKREIAQIRRLPDLNVYQVEKARLPLLEDELQDLMAREKELLGKTQSKPSELPEGLTEEIIIFNMDKYGKTRKEVIEQYKRLRGL